jgi:hypothetical protein
VSKLVGLIFIIIAIGSCALKPKPPKLPSVTTSGKNTFGCLVDDVIFKPKQSGYYQEHEYLLYYKSTGSLRINAHNAKDFNYHCYIYLNIDSIYAEGVYTSFDYTEPALVKNYFDDTPSQSYYLDPLALNQIEILKLDSITHIISATFQFTAIDTINVDTVSVTQGRFDFSAINFE